MDSLFKIQDCDLKLFCSHIHQMPSAVRLRTMLERTTVLLMCAISVHVRQERGVWMDTSDAVSLRRNNLRFAAGHPV